VSKEGDVIPEPPKFPRTAHLPESGGLSVRGEKALAKSDARRMLVDEVVVEEKVDGTNIGLWFDESGRFVLRHRGTNVKAVRTAEYQRLRAWAARYEPALRDVLGNRLALYGEWLYARHAIAYDNLPDYFIAFDVFDRERRVFLDTAARHRVASSTGLCEVPVLFRGVLGSLERLRSLLGGSRWSSTDKAEGLVVRLERDGVLILRAKFLRPGWVPGPELHWSTRAVELNRLAA